VLSTSDSWPHTGGVRQAVAMDLPVYILDLNRPLLDRMMSASSCEGLFDRANGPSRASDYRT